MTALNLVDKDTGWPLSTQVPRKGRKSSAYVLDAMEQYEQYVNTLWHKRVTLQLDAGNALRNVAWAIQERMGADKVKVRGAPNQGAGESEHSLLAVLVRAWLMD